MRRPPEQSIDLNCSSKIIQAPKKIRPLSMMLSFRLLVSGTSKIGNCKHFEDCTLGNYENKNTFLSVLDGHGSKEAVSYAHYHL